MVYSIRIIWPYLQRPVISRDCIAEASETCRRKAHLVGCRGAAGIDRKGMLEGLDGLFLPSKPGKDNSLEIGSAGMVLLHGEDLVECLKRVIVPAQVDAGDTPAVHGIGIIRLGSNCPIKIRHCLAETAQVLVGLAPDEVDPAVCRVISAALSRA